MRTPVKERPRVNPPPLSCSTGAHLIPVGPVTRPAIPSSHLVRWKRSGVGGGQRHKIEASQTKVKMSSSGSEGVAPASADHSGEHGSPPGY